MSTVGSCSPRKALEASARMKTSLAGKRLDAQAFVDHKASRQGRQRPNRNLFVLLCAAIRGLDSARRKEDPRAPCPRPSTIVNFQERSKDSIAVQEAIAQNRVWYNSDRQRTITTRDAATACTDADPDPTALHPSLFSSRSASLLRCCLHAAPPYNFWMKSFLRVISAVMLATAWRILLISSFLPE